MCTSVCVHVRVCDMDVCVRLNICMFLCVCHGSQVCTRFLCG